MHAGQLRVPVGAVRALVAEQFPRWAGLPVRPVRAEGTVNAVFRLGEELGARFPLAPGDVRAVREQLRAEAAATRELRGGTRVPVPEPVALGEPGHGYPLPWSVQTWLPGATASAEDPGASPAFARDLAGFVADVRAVGTRGRTFSRDGRGGDLRRHDGWVRTCLRESGGLLDVPRLRRLWERLRDLPRTAPDAMTHGDLVPGNVLVRDGRLAGVLDCGGLGPADPALDLVAAWHLLEAGPRRVLRRELGCGDLEWERGRAWALEQSLGLVWYYAVTNPVLSRTGRRTLERVLADEDATAGAVRPR
ncbi:aminoglycoside phosphotransferase family protein [Kineococcus indalonis]|uniref:aminoglycoside phosphotransferase family protein n=1 Tax=Kineococcus indalonis TaxID=2696566 RepID=UPI0014122BEC|nr:phosphotransferase [Kineococcus indalonis]